MINNSQTNYYGTWSLFKKEVWRFLKVYHQTLLSPVINALLLLTIFSLAVGNNIKAVGNIPFKEFMASGLIIMVAMQNSFANSSSSLVMSKVLGHVVDFLIPPISAMGILLAFVGGAVLRGIFVAIVAFVAVRFFIPLSFHSISYMVYCLIFASMFLGLLGVLCGIISDSFDHMSAVTSYLITPLTFLSGTFYSTNNLPELWQNIAHFNPFFYMIDGFRYSLTGYHDGNIIVGAVTILICNIVLSLIIHHLLKIGYRIKN